MMAEPAASTMLATMSREIARSLAEILPVEPAVAAASAVPPITASSVATVTEKLAAAVFAPREAGTSAIRDVIRWAMRCRRPFSPDDAVSVAGAVSVTAP
jgi:hypothetical protein